MWCLCSVGGSCWLPLANQLVYSLIPFFLKKASCNAAGDSSSIVVSHFEFETKDVSSILTFFLFHDLHPAWSTLPILGKRKLLLVLVFHFHFYFWWDTSASSSTWTISPIRSSVASTIRVVVIASEPIPFILIIKMGLWCIADLRIFGQSQLWIDESHSPESWKQWHIFPPECCQESEMSNFARLQLVFKWSVCLSRDAEDWYDPRH